MIPSVIMPPSPLRAGAAPATVGHWRLIAERIEETHRRAADAMLAAADAWGVVARMTTPGGIHVREAPAALRHARDATMAARAFYLHARRVMRAGLAR